MKLSMEELQSLGSDILRTVSEICEKNNVPWFMAYGSLLGTIRHHGPIPWDYDIDIYVPENQLERFVEVMKEQLPGKYWVDYRDDEKKQRSFPRVGLSGYETEILHVDVYRLSGLPVNPVYFKLFAKYSRILFVMWKSRMIDINSYYPDRKRRIVSKTVLFLTKWIPLKTLIRRLDAQANRIPLTQASYSSCPFETQSLRKRVPNSIWNESLLMDYEDFKVRVPKEYSKYLEIEYGQWETLPPEEEREKQMKKSFDVKEL